MFMGFRGDVSRILICVDTPRVFLYLYIYIYLYLFIYVFSVAHRVPILLAPFAGFPIQRQFGLTNFLYASMVEHNYFIDNIPAMRSLIRGTSSDASWRMGAAEVRGARDGIADVPLDGKSRVKI